MMLIKKRRNAIIIAVAVILLSTVFGVHRSLGPEVRAVEDSFREGVYDTRAGYRLPSVYRQLVSRCEASNNLLSVAANYDGLSEKEDALREAKRELQNALDSGTKPSALYRLNEELGTRFNALYTALSPVADGPDAEYIIEDAARMENAARLIESSGYNEQAGKFNRETMGVFPTNILKHIVFIKDADLFE